LNLPLDKRESKITIIAITHRIEKSKKALLVHWEIYAMNAADGSGNRNLTDNVAENDESPEWGR